MGGVHSSCAPPCQVVVVVPSKGNKILKRKFVKDVPQNSDMTIAEYFEEELRPLITNGNTTGTTQCGDVLKVSVVVQGEQDEIEVDALTDACATYTQMRLSKVVFYVEQVDNMDAALRNGEQVQSVADVLIREPTLQLPQWSHSGRPAVTKLFQELRRLMESDKLGFYGARDLHLGCDWMVSLSQLLYKLSPFHGKFKARGHPMPSRFAFSDGANDYKKKGKAPPMLSQELMENLSS